MVGGGTGIAGNFHILLYTFLCCLHIFKKIVCIMCVRETQRLISTKRMYLFFQSELFLVFI